jgi:sigma-B regulation protein RsbU (phosphoserine phosphatase)
MAYDRHSAAETEDFFQNAPCALLVTDRTGLILKVNRTFCDWIGFSADELVDQRKLQELLTVGGRIFYQTHWMPVLQLQRSLAEVKLDFKTRNGDVLPMVLNTSRRKRGEDDFDDVSAFVVMERHRFEQEVLAAKQQAEKALQDHLTLKQKLSVADTRLRIAHDTAQLYIWDVDPVTLTRRYDERVAELLGFNSPQDIPMDAYAGFIDKNDLGRESAAFENALISGNSQYRCTYRLNGVDGRQRTVLSTATGVFDEQGKLLQFVGVLHDISEITNQRASAEGRALFAEQMIGIVSHDLRNPLQITSMAIEYLQSRDLGTREAKMVGHVRDATSRAQKLINELLDFTQAKIGQGLSVDKQPVQFNEMVGNCISSLRLIYPQREIVFTAGNPVQCLVDADRMVQVIGNLLVNAMTYADSSTPITITTGATDTDVFVAIHNFGPPISEQAIQTLFEPMARGMDVPQGVRSVGLGLFIVSEIAKAHGGSVEVVSERATGTTFTVSIPND